MPFSTPDTASVPNVLDAPHLPAAQKARLVRGLFSAVAPTYDLLNTVLSFGLHKWWRRVATDECRLAPGDPAIDVATGTGDFALEQRRRVGPSGYVVGVDFCLPMLRAGARKMSGKADLVQGDALALPFPDAWFSAATMGFALRNVGDIQIALEEMVRVVRPGGRVVQLELAKPQGPVFRAVYNLYFERLLPLIGKLIHGKREHYAYLPESLRSFASREEIVDRMQRAGLESVTVRNLTWGIVAVYAGTRSITGPRIE